MSSLLQHCCNTASCIIDTSQSAICEADELHTARPRRQAAPKRFQNEAATLDDDEDDPANPVATLSAPHASAPAVAKRRAMDSGGGGSAAAVQEVLRSVAGGGAVQQPSQLTIPAASKHSYQVELSPIETPYDVDPYGLSNAALGSPSMPKHDDVTPTPAPPSSLQRGAATVTAGRDHRASRIVPESGGAAAVHPHATSERTAQATDAPQERARKATTRDNRPPPVSQVHSKKLASIVKGAKNVPLEVSRSKDAAQRAPSVPLQSRSGASVGRQRSAPPAEERPADDNEPPSFADGITDTCPASERRPEAAEALPLPSNTAAPAGATGPDAMMAWAAGLAGVAAGGAPPSEAALLAAGRFFHQMMAQQGVHMGGGAAVAGAQAPAAQAPPPQMQHEDAGPEVEACEPCGENVRPQENASGDLLSLALVRNRCILSCLPSSFERVL